MESFMTVVAPVFGSASCAHVNSYAWWKGRTETYLSSFAHPIIAHESSVAVTRFLCESITPLLVPVVPDVKSIAQVLSRSTL